MSLRRIITLEKQVKLLQETVYGLTERLAGLEGVNEVTLVGDTASLDTAADAGNDGSVKPVVVRVKPKAKPKPKSPK